MRIGLISQKDCFKKDRNDEGERTERLKLIHKEIKGKKALIGVGGLLFEKDSNYSIITGFSWFIAVRVASILNKDFIILLKEGKGNILNLELDTSQP